MKHLKQDICKFFNYAVFQAKSDLKTEVANSYLNWMWWILDPLFYMLVYTFVSAIVFRTTEPYFPIFVFIGQTVWSFFSKMVIQSVVIIRSNKHIITKVYVPKYILILSKVFVNGFKMCISFLLIAILMLVYNVPLAFRIFLAVPITMNMVLITFGICTIVAHLGVFFEDLKHLTEVMLQFLFYFTGIFYDIEKRIPQPFGNLLIYFNPIAYHIYALRNVCLYGERIDVLPIIIWFVIGILCGLLGIRNIYKYENTYVKII